MLFTDLGRTHERPEAHLFFTRTADFQGFGALLEAFGELIKNRPLDIHTLRTKTNLTAIGED